MKNAYRYFIPVLFVMVLWTLFPIFIHEPLHCLPLWLGNIGCEIDFSFGRWSATMDISTINNQDNIILFSYSRVLPLFFQMSLLFAIVFNMWRGYRFKNRFLRTFTYISLPVFLIIINIGDYIVGMLGRIGADMTPFFSIPALTAFRPLCDFYLLANIFLAAAWISLLKRDK